MTRYALDIHPDDAEEWLRVTGRDEARPYDMPPLRSTEFLVNVGRSNKVRLTVREIQEEEE